MIAAVGPTAEVLAEWGDDGADGRRGRGDGAARPDRVPLAPAVRRQPARRVRRAPGRGVAGRGRGPWRRDLVKRGIDPSRGDPELAEHLESSYGHIVRGGVTTLEVKSGYGLEVEQELRQLELLQRSREATPMGLVISFLGAHVVPAGTDADTYTDEVLAMLERVLEQGIAEFHDITVERGLFTPAQALRMFQRSRELGIPTRAHSDAWASSEGWKTAVRGGAISAEHLTYTPDEEIREVGETDTIAVLLPQAELVYMTDRRANARLFIDRACPWPMATDYCSSIHATSLASTIALAAPWFRITPAEAVVGGDAQRGLRAGRAAPTAARSTSASAAT